MLIWDEVSECWKFVQGGWRIHSEFERRRLGESFSDEREAVRDEVSELLGTVEGSGELVMRCAVRRRRWSAGSARDAIGIMISLGFLHCHFFGNL